jgi:FKBP-type peptidyl-prolyl cis-trans isomerase
MASLSSRVLLLALVVCAAPVLRAQREKLPPEDLEFVEKTWPNAKATVTGIRYVIQTEGAGEPARSGETVELIYAGRLISGKIFDQNTDRAHPFVFRVDREMVVPGLDQILQLMRKGERRLVIIPPELAYGTRGSPPRIPRNATLIFLVELLDIKRE